MAAVPSPKTSGTKTNVENKSDENTRPPTVEELLIQIESHLYHSVEHRASLLIAAWTCLGGQIGYFRSMEKVFQTMYRESAMLIFSGNWTKVDMLFKRGLSRAIIQYSHSKGCHVDGSEGLCSALVMAIYDPWGDPAISHLFQKEEIDVNKVNVFIKSEPKQLLLLRVECLVNAHCEEAAIRLCRSYLQNSAPPPTEFHHVCDNENWRLSFLEWLVRLLFRKRRLNDLIAETSTCSCHDGVRLIYRTMDSNTEDSESLTESLINLFLVRDLLFKSNYCCTSDLMKLWCELQVKKQKSISEVQESARKLLVGHASSSAQFYLFVDVLWGKFGISLFPLYLELYVRGLTTDLNHLEAARQTEQKECVLEIENHMSAMYFKLSSLFSSVNKEISLECLFSAFSLNPTREILDWIKKMSLQITKEKGLRAAGCANICKHNKGTCTHNCSYPLPVKRKAVVMCDQAIQVGDDFIAQCTDSANCSNDNGRKKFANEANFLNPEEKDKVPSIEKSNMPESSSVKEKELEKVNQDNSANHITTSTTNFNKVNDNCMSESENCAEKTDKSELILNSIPESDDKSTSHSKNKNLSIKDADVKNCSKNPEANTGCNDFDHGKDSVKCLENADSQLNQHVNGIDCEKDMDCSDKDTAKVPITSEVGDNSDKDITHPTDEENQNLKSQGSAENQENGVKIVNGEANSDSHKMNGFTDSESLPKIEVENSKMSGSCKTEIPNDDQIAAKKINLELNGDLSIPMDIDNPDNANKVTENSLISGERPEACNTLSNSIESKENKWPESLKYQSYVTRFSHVVLDSKLPGISADLLSDFVSVLESLRNKQLKSSSKWSQIKHLCEDYLEIVSEQRCTMLNLHHNGSIDSEADSSVSELTARDVYDFECQQSNGSAHRDRIADKSSVFKRFLNSDNAATEMATYVNLSDIHCPQIPLEKLFTEYSSSHAGHKKRHKRHRNHDKSPKKSVLRKLRHGSRVERDMIKHKKRKKRKGKHGKGHTKKHHSTHGKDNKVHSKKKKHKLKKKKDGNSGFISGDYCSDFSSEMLMRIVKEHSNSYSKTLATTSKHPHNINSASSSDSGEPSRKKRKVSFDKKHGKIVKYRDKHKHIKSKSDKHKKKITLESCKASVTNVIHNNPSNDIKGPHFVQISRVKKMESVQIQQSSVSMVDDSLNGTSVIDPCVSNPELKQFVQQNFESYSPDDIMKMQLLMARQQAEVTAGSSTMTSNQALRKYVCSKMTSQLLSVAQSSKCTIHSDSETSKSPTPNFMNKTSIMDKSSKITKPQNNPQKITANIKHFVIETNKPSYRMPNSNIRNVTSSVVPVSISGNQYSDAQSLIGSMLNSNIRCPTSQGSPQVTAFSIPFAHSSTGNKVVTSKIIIPLPSSSQAQSGASSNLSLIPAENSSFSTAPSNASHSSFIIVKNGNSTQILPGPQNPCNILSCIPNLNAPRAIITNRAPAKPRTTKPKRAPPVAKRSLIKNPLLIKPATPNIPDSVPKAIPLRGPPPVSAAVMETSQNSLSNSDVLDLSSSVSEQTNSKISNSLSVPLEPPINLSKLSPTDLSVMKNKINTNETSLLKPDRFMSLNIKESDSNETKKIEEADDLTVNKSNIISKYSLETSALKPAEILSSSTISTESSSTISKAMNFHKEVLKSNTPETVLKSMNELNTLELIKSADAQKASSIDVSREKPAFSPIGSSVDKLKASSSEVPMPSVDVPITNLPNVPKENSFDASKANSADIQEVNSIEKAKENLAELPKDSLTSAVKTCSIEVPRENSAELPKECSAELLSSAEILKDSSCKISKEGSAEIQKENLAEMPKESSAEMPKESSAKISKDSSVEIPKESSTKLPKEMSAKLPKEISAKLPKGRPARLPKGRPAKLPKGRSAKLPRGSSDEIPKERLDEIFKECSAEISKKESTEIAKVTSAKIPEKNSSEVAKNSSFHVTKAISTDALTAKSVTNEMKNGNDIKVTKSKFLKAVSNEPQPIGSLTEASVSDSKIGIKETSSDTKDSDNIDKIKSEDMHISEKIKAELQESLSEKDKNITTRKIANTASKSPLDTELFTKIDCIKDKFPLTQPSISTTYDDKSFIDGSINSSNTSTLLETQSIHDNKTSPDTKSDVLTEKENKALLLDQDSPIDSSPLSKECGSPSKDTDQRKQLQPINSISIMASLKTSKEKSSIKSDGVPVSEVPTRSFTSISDAVRFSLMDMDDATDSVENQVLQSFQVTHEASGNSPRYDNTSTNDGNEQASPSAVILNTSQSSSTTDLNATPGSQRFESTVHNSESEKFSDCQSTVSRPSTWILEESALNETSQTINLQKSPEIESSCESKEEEKPKKKKKRKERCDPEAAHKFWCEICHKGFFSAYNLRRHCRNVHKMALPKGSSELPFTSNSHHQLIQQSENSSPEMVTPPRIGYGAQSSCLSPKTPDFMLHSPSRESKSQDFASKTATSQHASSIQADFQMQTASRMTGQSPSHLSSSPNTKTVQSDFQLPTPSSVTSAHVSPNKLPSVAKSPSAPKFQRLPTPCSTAAVSPMSQISLCGQQAAMQQQRQLSQIQSPGLIQPVPNVSCQTQLQSAQCPHFQSKQITQQRMGQLQLMHHASQLPAIQHPSHGIQKQTTVQQFKKCSSSLQSSKLSETEQIQQTAQLAQTQQILANQQMQKIMQIRQNAIAATGVATQLSLGAAGMSVPQSPNVKAATQCFQSQLAVARQAAAVAQLSASQRNPAANFGLGSHDTAAHQFFASSMQPTPEQSSCSHASFSAQNLVEYNANAPSYPTIRLSSEANDGLEDLEQFLMENMPWSSDQSATHGLAQQSGNRPASTDSLSLTAPTSSGSQHKSKTPISRPKPRKPVVSSCSKNLLGNLGRGVKKKSAPKKASKASTNSCSISKSTSMFPQNCVSQQTHGLDLMQMHCDKGTSGDLKQACKSATATTLNETDSSDSIQCINVAHHNATKNLPVGLNFNTFVPPPPCLVPDKSINPSYSIDMSNPRVYGMQNKNSFLEHGNLVNKNSSNLGQNKLINQCEINSSHFSHNEKETSFNPVPSFCQTACSSITTKKSETGPDIFLGQRNSETSESSNVNIKSDTTTNIHSVTNSNCFSTKTDNIVFNDQNPSTNVQPDHFLGGRTGDTTSNSEHASDRVTDNVTSSNFISSEAKHEIWNNTDDGDTNLDKENNMVISKNETNLISNSENDSDPIICNNVVNTHYESDNLESCFESENKTTVYKNIPDTPIEPILDNSPPIIENSTINTEQMQELGMKDISFNKVILKDKIYSSDYKEFNPILTKTVNSSKQNFNGFTVSRILNDSSQEISSLVTKKIDNKENVSCSSVVKFDHAKPVFKNCDKLGLMPKFSDYENNSSLESVGVKGDKIISDACKKDIEKVHHSDNYAKILSDIGKKQEDCCEANNMDNNLVKKINLPDKQAVHTKTSRKSLPKKKPIQESSTLSEKNKVQDKIDDFKLDINSNIEKPETIPNGKHCAAEDETIPNGKHNAEDLEIVSNGKHCAEDDLCEVEDIKEAQENEEYFANPKQPEDPSKSSSRLRLRDTSKASAKRVCPCCVDSGPKKCRSPKVHNSSIKAKGTLKARNASNIQNTKINTRSSQRLRSRNNTGVS